MRIQSSTLRWGLLLVPLMGSAAGGGCSSEEIAVGPRSYTYNPPDPNDCVLKNPGSTDPVTVTNMTYYCWGGWWCQCRYGKMEKVGGSCR